MLFLIEEKRTHAVTLIELMVTIVIIGILAAMAIPMFPRVMETTKAKEAVAALEQIRTGERVYRVEEGDYWPVGILESDIGDINEQLRLYLDTRDERNWNYSVGATSGVSPNPDTFIATATRRGTGSHDGETIVFTQDGLDGAASTWSLPLPGQ